MVDLVTGIIFPPPVIGECDLQQFHSCTTLGLILFVCSSFSFVLFSIITVTQSVSLSNLHSLEALWMSSLILWQTFAMSWSLLLIKGLSGRRRVKSAMRRRGYIQGFPEVASASLTNSGSVQLFNTHIPFPIPILESQVKENRIMTTSKVLKASALLEGTVIKVTSDA